MALNYNLSKCMTYLLSILMINTLGVCPHFPVTSLNLQDLAMDHDYLYYPNKNNLSILLFNHLNIKLTQFYSRNRTVVDSRF